MRISDWSSDVCSSDLSPACFGSHGAKCCALLPSSALGFNERLRQVKGLQGDGQGVLDVRPFDAIGAVKIGADQQAARLRGLGRVGLDRSEEHTSELQSLMRTSYAVFCLKKKKIKITTVKIPTDQTTSLRMCHTSITGPSHFVTCH